VHLNTRGSVSGVLVAVMEGMGGEEHDVAMVTMVMVANGDDDDDDNEDIKNDNDGGREG
jgi:hypothetical protein